MSQYLVSPLLGHIEFLYHMFEYLRNHKISRIVFDTFQPNVDESTFVMGKTDWKDFYGGIEGEIPPGMPEPLGKIAHTTFFVCANYDGNVVTRHFHTGVFIYVINFPIVCLSKNWNTVEGCTFGYKLLLVRISRDLIASMCYK